MSQRIQDQGLVLHTRPYRETSAIISVLTEQHGLVRGVLKGWRKRSKTAPVGQLTLVTVEYLGGGELRTLTRLEANRSLMPGPASMSLALLCSEACYRLMAIEHQDAETYHLLLSTLHHLQSEASKGVVVHFLKEFLILQGYDAERELSHEISLNKERPDNTAYNDASALSETMMLSLLQGVFQRCYPGKSIRTFNLIIKNRP
jgi:DNA repair protein RecO